MATLVTGARGFLGELLTERLVKEGKEVHAMLHSTSKGRVPHHEGVKVFQGDVEDRDSIRRAMEGCEEVYHLAALATNWAPDDTLFYRVNVEGTENVLEVARELGVKKIVHTSTAATLGPQKGNGVVDESHQLQLEEALTHYERTKIQAETRVKEHVKNFGMNVVTVNPTRLYGPGRLRKSNAMTKIVRDYLKGLWRLIPGNGKGVGNYVFTEDVISGHLLAMKHGRAGERYLLAGENIDFEGFFQKLKEVSGVSRRMFKVPVPLLITASKAMKGYSIVTGKPPLITPQWVRKYLGSQWGADPSKAQKELGYGFRGLDDGIGSTVEWLHRSGYIPSRMIKKEELEAFERTS